MVIFRASMEFCHCITASIFELRGLFRIACPTWLRDATTYEDVCEAAEKWVVLANKVDHTCVRKFFDKRSDGIRAGF